VSAPAGTELAVRALSVAGQVLGTSAAQTVP
jgi:hypothetical protein